MSIRDMLKTAILKINWEQLTNEHEIFKRCVVASINEGDKTLEAEVIAPEAVREISSSCLRSTVVQISQNSRRKYWATRSSVRSFARTAHSFACSGLLASLAPSAALTRSLARSLRSLPRSWESV